MCENLCVDRYNIMEKESYKLQSGQREIIFVEEIAENISNSYGNACTNHSTSFSVNHSVLQNIVIILL